VKLVSAARLVLMMVIALAAPVVQGAAASTDANYPTKPIRLIVPFSPGGTNDILARMIAIHLTDTLGKTVIVDNRGGAEGIIGTDMAVKAAPDGYTLVILSAAYVMNPAVRKMPYDATRDLDIIAKLGTSATVLCVGPSLPVNSLKEMLAVAKSKPGQITMGTSGGFQHFATALFRSLTGQDFNLVMYKGTFPAMMEVIGGQLHANILPIVPSLPHLRGGRLKALGMGTLKRSALLPDLATLDELGVSGYDAANMYMIATTARTPPAIVKRLYTLIVDYMRLPDTQKKLTAMGAEVDIRTGEEMRKVIPVEIAKWTQVAIAAGMPREQ
jgi:tripartite-type tricarboxylate transporter receptor subunit TctC